MPKLNPQEVARKVARRVLAEELTLVNRRLALLERDRDRDRSRIELGLETAHAFEAARASTEYQAVFDEENPLVSVVVATYNRSEKLRERALDSLLNQTYSNLQIIVVGDHCTDDTFERLAEINDPRIEAYNLPERGTYPSDRDRRWMVAGTSAVNEGLARARGSFITHLDDDDRHGLDRVEKLVRTAQETRSDLVWHPFRHEMPGGRWLENEAREFLPGFVTTSSIFYHKWFKDIPWDVDAHYFREPGDWNRLRKIQWLDAKCTRYDEYLLDHFREGANS